MKYIIDVEKIEGTNLWKAKEFNTLVFDKNGLMKLMTLEDELGDYYVDLRNEIYEMRKLIEFLRGENELYRKQIKSNKKLKEMYEEKCLEVESLLDTGKLPKEENVPIEEVVCADLKGMNVVDEETVVRLMTNLFEHSEREWQRLTHTIKSQKGMLKKQGKDISRLQKENKKLKETKHYLTECLEEIRKGLSNKPTTIDEYIIEMRKKRRSYRQRNRVQVYERCNF